MLITIQKIAQKLTKIWNVGIFCDLFNIFLKWLKSFTENRYIYIDSLDIHRCKNKITFPFKQRKANILTLFRIHKSTNGELSIILSKVLKH